MTLDPKVRNLLEMAKRGELPKIDYPTRHLYDFSEPEFLVCDGKITVRGYEKLELERLREKEQNKKGFAFYTPPRKFGCWWEHVIGDYPQLEDCDSEKIKSDIESLRSQDDKQRKRLHKIESFLAELTSNKFKP